MLTYDLLGARCLLFILAFVLPIQTIEQAKSYFKRKVKFVTEQMEKVQMLGIEKSQVRDGNSYLFKSCETIKVTCALLFYSCGRSDGTQSRPGVSKSAATTSASSCLIVHGVFLFYTLINKLLQHKVSVRFNCCTVFMSIRKNMTGNQKSCRKTIF